MQFKHVANRNVRFQMWRKYQTKINLTFVGFRTFDQVYKLTQFQGGKRKSDEDAEKRWRNGF